MKEKIKKIISLGIGGLMLGITVSSAFASSGLEDYPKPFNQGPTYIAVGSLGKASDVLGAVDIMTSLQTTEEVEEPETTVELKGITEEIGISESLKSGFGSKLDDNDLDVLKDDILDYEGEDYDYSEEILLYDNFKVETSLTSVDYDYETDVAIEILKNNLEYSFNFDDSIDLSQVDSSEPLEINFLGRPLTILEIDTSEIVTRLSNEYTWGIGNSTEIDGKVVTLRKIGTSSIVVDVDGEEEIISEGDTETVNNIDVSVNEIFYDDDKQDRIVELLIGTKAQKTYSDGDEYIGEDESDPNWVWNLEDVNQTKPKIKITYDNNQNNAEDEVIRVSECLSLPHEFVNFCFEGLKNDNYNEYNLYFEDIDDPDNNEVKVLVIESTTNDGLSIGNNETQKVYINETNGLFYQDNGDVESTSVNEFIIEYGDTKLLGQIISGDLVLTDDLNNNITIDINVSNMRLGSTQDEAETTDIKYNNLNIGSIDKDLRTKWGVILKDIENLADDDEVVLEVPDDRIKAVITTTDDIEKKEEITKPTEPKVTATPVVVLDTELSIVENKNIIVVGGPAVNSLAVRFLGITADEYRATYSAGEAVIKLVENGDNKVALIVAGYNADDTRRASKVLQNYGSFSLEGSEALVKGTSLKTSDITVS